jgi:hypothetical protein
MKPKFNPSVNILRDLDSDFYYIKTPNSENVLDRINENIESDYKCFYLVGSYGTGKSSFLLALEKQLSGKRKYFKKTIKLNKTKKFKFINIVGEYNSFQQTFLSKINSKKNFISDFNFYYNNIKKQNKGLIIIVDEFGKFLEYAIKNNPEKELYFIQLLSEYINDPKKNIVFISAIHQSFDSYKFELEQKQKREWDKIKGRLKEILFNEPVEQLLFLASQYIINKKTNNESSHLNKLLKCFIESNLISSRFFIDIEVAKKLLPMDVLAACILIQSLQNFGQNERSLFTFLDSYEQFGLRKYDKTNNPYFNLNCVYDYLSNEFYSVIYSKHNQDYIKWVNIKNSLERAEVLFDKDYNNYSKIIKTIGLLNIYTQKGAIIDNNFLLNYGKMSLGIPETQKILDELKKKKIIRFLEYRKTYILFEGTDLDLDLEFNRVDQIINLPGDITHLVKEYVHDTYIPANSVSIKKGFPRFFKIRINEVPIQNSEISETDGTINLIISKKFKLNEIVDISKNSDDSVIFVIYKNIDYIEKALLQIEKTKYLINEYRDDSLALKELTKIKDHFISELKNLFQDSLINCDDNLIWLYKGEKRKITNRKDLNELLSNICNEVYFSVPTFNNELINRNRLPAPISTARKNLLLNLLENWDKEDIGFPKDTYPPERTIYLSLLKNTGIHRKVGESYVLDNPSNESFNQLWLASEEFLESAKSNKKSLINLFDILRKKPFKLKQGFLDFWIPIFLVIKKDDFALFDNNGYIPNLSSSLFDLFIKKPGDFYIKTFDVKGIKLEIFNKYREIINHSSENIFSNKNFIETIKPFLVFYKNLPEYSKRTKKLSKHAIQLRDTIANAKEPEKTFFEDFPNSLGYNILNLKESNDKLESYFLQLQKYIKEIRECYTHLVNKVESHIIKTIETENKDFPDYKRVLSKRLNGINANLLNQQQKVVLARLNSEINERDGWLNSFVYAIIGKSLDVITDEEENILYEKIIDTINEFYNLIDIFKFDNEESDSDVVKFELTTISKGTRKIIVSIPKNGELKDIESNIKKYLTKDIYKNQKILLKLLKEQIDGE